MVKEKRVTEDIEYSSDLTFTVNEILKREREINNLKHDIFELRKSLSDTRDYEIKFRQKYEVVERQRKNLIDALKEIESITKSTRIKRIIDSVKGRD